MADGGAGDGGGGGRVDSIWNSVGMGRWPSIPHYYGDAARQLMLGAAALMLVASPFYGNDLRVEFPFIVVGALVAVAFAALTNPRDLWVSVVDAVVVGVGFVVFATWGIFGYETTDPIALVLRLAIGVIFLFAFYFSLKTVRAFMLRQIGKRETIDEFETEAERARAEELETETMTRSGTH